MSPRTVFGLILAVVGTLAPALALGIVFGFDKKVSTADRGAVQVLSLVGSMLVPFFTGIIASSVMRKGESGWSVFDITKKLFDTFDQRPPGGKGLADSRS